MKKTTSQKLSRRLTQYGALTVAIAGVTQVNGQIIYTDVDPDYTSSPNEFYIMDLNGDGFEDFVFYQRSYDAVRAFPVGGGYLAYNSLLHAFKGFSSSFFNYPYNLATGNIISAAGPWNSNYAYNDFCIGSGYPNSQFCGGVTDGFIGLRFKIAGNFHYGWARLDVISSSSYIIKDYAYNATPGASIAAGDTGSLGIGENELNKIKVVALNKSIGLYNLPPSSSYNLYNMTGQKVLNGSTIQKEHVIEATSLASGVYVLELTDTNSKGVIRKKVVLQ